MYQAIVFIAAAVLSLGIVLIFRNQNNKIFDKVFGALVLLYCAVGFFRGYLSDSFIYVINGGWFETVYYEKNDFLQSILRWGYNASYAVLPMAVFYKGRFFKNVASYICLPFSILSAVFFDDFMAYFLEPNNHGYKFEPWFRYTIFVVELVLAIAIPVILQLKEKHVLNIKDKKEIIDFLIGFPAVLLVSMPVYIPQSLFGYTIHIVPSYGDFHITWIAILLVVCVGLYYIFRFKSREERLELCMFLAILLFFQRNLLYLMGLNIKRLPFQLCNIASYFYLVALTFNWKKMFHFAFIANVVGTLIAILMPDFSQGSISFWNMHYLIEHSLVLIVPAMVMGLRIFPRLEKKSLKYLWIGFTAYFIVTFVLGVFFNGYSDVTGETVNYFYMFDFEVATDFFPFLIFAEKYVIELGRFSFNPFIVGLIYVAFSLLCFLFYLLVMFCYKMEDDHLALRGSSIDLYEKITHKTSRRPKQFIE